MRISIETTATDVLTAKYCALLAKDLTNREEAFRIVLRDDDGNTVQTWTSK